MDEQGAIFNIFVFYVQVAMTIFSPCHEWKLMNQFISVWSEMKDVNLTINRITFYDLNYYTKKSCIFYTLK